MSDFRNRHNSAFIGAYTKAQGAKQKEQRYNGFDEVTIQDMQETTAKALAALLEIYWVEQVRLLKDSRTGAEALAEFAALTFPGAVHLGNAEFEVDLSEPLAEFGGQGTQTMHIAEILDYLVFDLKHFEKTYADEFAAEDKITLEYALDAARDPAQWPAVALLTAVALGQPVNPAPATAPQTRRDAWGNKI
ncbi:hypothetical protein [Corynebacterium sp. A21]|uniref:hypothetical protein n=1 Tax=Corynebacterium sp. A21 TaxID=3457318 RepID=UPI003FD321F8